MFAASDIIWWTGVLGQSHWGGTAVAVIKSSETFGKALPLIVTTIVILLYI